jgi:hypothetical protein
VRSSTDRWQDRFGTERSKADAAVAVDQTILWYLSFL